MKNFISMLSCMMFCIICISFHSAAQTKQDSIRTLIETNDGNEFVGVIVDQTPERIKLKTDKLGELSLLRSDIKKITELSGVRSTDGKYWLDNPQSTRYFWSPNGYSLKKDEGYYQNVWVFFNQVVYGFTDHLSGGAGIVPLFLFGTSTPAWVTLKYSIPVVKNKVNLAIGALAGTVLGEQNSGFGILYGTGTFGSKDNNVSVGAGWAYGSGEMATFPTFNVSGMFRTGPKGYILTENYIIGGSNSYLVLMSFGARKIVKHMGLDFGLFVPFGTDVDTFFAAPWLGLTIPFGSPTTSTK